MSVASWSGSLLAWEQELTALKARVARVLPRRELRETGADFLDGLLSGIERKTGWLMAEQSERSGRIGCSRCWGAATGTLTGSETRFAGGGGVGDEDGVLIVDETGFVKKGDRSAGVARQYSGTAGRIENSQIGVFLAYASRYGQALVDRRLYLLERWTKDRARCARASIPETVDFATKPKMARAMVEAALDAGALEGIVCLRKPRPRNWPASSSPTTGPVMRQVKAPKGLGSTTGHASAALERQKAASSTGFSSAASDRHPEKKPTTWSSPRPLPPWPNWRQWPACAGRSRSVLSAPRMISDLIIARLGPGTDGIAI